MLDQARASVKITASEEGVDAAVASTEAKLNRLKGAGTQAAEGVSSIGRAAQLLRRTFNLIVLPAGIAASIVGVVKRLDEMRDAGERARQSLADMGREAANALEQASRPDARTPEDRLRELQASFAARINALGQEELARRQKIEGRNAVERALAWMGFGESIEDVEAGFTQAIQSIESARKIATERAAKAEDKRRVNRLFAIDDEAERKQAELLTDEIKQIKARGELSLGQIRRKYAEAETAEERAAIDRLYRIEEQLLLRQISVVTEAKKKQARELLDELRKVQAEAFGPDSNFAGISSGTALQQVSLGLSFALRMQGGR